MRTNSGEEAAARLAGLDRPAARPVPGGRAPQGAPRAGWVPPPPETEADAPDDTAGRTFAWGRPVPPRAALAAAVVAVALLLGGGARVLVQQPEVVRVPPRPGAVSAQGLPEGSSSERSGTPAGRPEGAAPGGSGPPEVSGGPGAPPGSGRAGGEVVVHVVGRVRRPGVQRLPSGARVADAVAAAGGVSAGAVVQRVNLARVLVDGEQVLVPGPGDPEPAAGIGGSQGAGRGPGPATGLGTGPAGGGQVNLNTAGESELDALPGVGPVLAGRIVAWRAQHGRFSRVDELGEVAGIGPTLLQRLRPLVSV